MSRSESTQESAEAGFMPQSTLWPTVVFFAFLLLFRPSFSLLNALEETQYLIVQLS